MSTENIVSKKYRILSDVANKVWDVISFFTLAKDVELTNGKNLETTCGSITGITSSLTSTSTTMAASASAIKQLNDKIADLNSNLSKEPTVVGEYQNTENNSLCTATITLEKNTHYMIVSGISKRSIEQNFTFSITTNSGSYEIIREAKRIPAFYTASEDGDGVYYYIIKTGADGANITISKKRSTFDVLKL